MPSASVRADYDELAQIAKLFSQQSSNIAKVNRRIKSVQESLQGGDWIGKGATAFFREMESEVNPSMKRLGQAMAEASSTTSQISKAMKEAEDQSSRLLAVIVLS